MSAKINTNIPGMTAGNQLNKGYGALTGSLKRISTGRRINSAADDASGMSIADRLRSHALGLGQAARNAADGISIVQIADGALDEAAAIVQDIRVKALQAANASQSPESRSAIQTDIDNSLESLDNIARSTAYNGQKLLSGTFTGKTFVVGAGPEEAVTLSIDSAESATLGRGENEGSLADIDVTTPDGAQDAIRTADSALSQINRLRSDLGAKHNQFHATINNLNTSRISSMASESGIRDVDLAEESANMNRLDLLFKARLFALAQANSTPKNVLSLLSK